MNYYFKIYIAGLIILIVAILLNIIATNLRISTWFSLIKEINENGFTKTINNQSIISILFLFLIYPFLLGLFVFLFFNFVK
jgi:hypothetical protein